MNRSEFRSHLDRPLLADCCRMALAIMAYAHRQIPATDVVAGKSLPGEDSP
ncbi:MAG: hypothetical protein ACJATR_002795 [Halopseudomonas sp.]|jgi:hypothetical protein